MFAANVEALEPNKEGVVNDVDPNRFDVVEAPKAEELNAGVLETPNPGLPNAGFGANGLEDVVDENGLAAG